MNAAVAARSVSGARRPAWVALGLLLVTTVAFTSVAASSQGKKRASKRAHQRVYRIALSFPFPPWGVGPLEGVDFDLITAIREANSSMKCRLEDRPSSDCVDTDENGQMIIGPALASGKVDGCMAWFATDERIRLGAEFAEGYSRGPLTQLIAADGDARYDGLGASGSLDGGNVGFIAGFFNDDDCLGRHYTDFTADFYDSDQEGRDDMVLDLLAGVIDLVFWDSVATVPDGTHVVGEPVTDCGPLLSLITFPPRTSRPHHADALRRAFNCGLALIRESGEMQEICESSTHPGGDPTCVFEGPPPTVQCVEANSEDDGPTPWWRRH